MVIYLSELGNMLTSLKNSTYVPLSLSLSPHMSTYLIQRLATKIFHTPLPSFAPTILINQSHHFHFESTGKNRFVIR